MNKITLIPSLLILLPVPAFAQDDIPMPTPAAHMANFEPLLGSWTGKGVHRESADGEAMEWTATMSFTKILGGFAVQEDLVIEVGAPTKLLMRTVYGHDNESGRSIAANVGNQGELHVADYAFTDKGTLVVYGSSRSAEGFGVGRSRVEFTKDSYRFSHEGSINGGKVFTEVEGSFTRASDASAKYVSNASFMNVPISAEMKALESFNGSYKITGNMVWVAGMEPIAIAGTETYSSLWGGQTLMSTIVGDAEDGAPVYQSNGYMCWDGSRNSYVMVSFDSMGMAGEAVGRWTEPGTEMVFATSNIMMGNLVNQNTVINVGDRGITGVKSHTLSGASAPYVGFDAKYARTK